MNNETRLKNLESVMIQGTENKLLEFRNYLRASCIPPLEALTTCSRTDTKSLIQEWMLANSTAQGNIESIEI
jgi:hypothetical protein